MALAMAIAAAVCVVGVLGVLCRSCPTPIHVWHLLYSSFRIHVTTVNRKVEHAAADEFPFLTADNDSRKASEAFRRMLQASLRVNRAPIEWDVCIGNCVRQWHGCQGRAAALRTGIRQG